MFSCLMLWIAFGLWFVETSSRHFSMEEKEAYTEKEKAEANILTVMSVPIQLVSMAIESSWHEDVKKSLTRPDKTFDDEDSGKGK